MRRSVREASLGFCLLAAIASGLGLWFWLKGLSLGRQTWTMEASFQDAAGLAPRSPVSYRGVMVGSVQALRVTDREVVAELTITDPKLRLAQPVVARVAPSSLLGGDAAVSLLSAGRPLGPGGPGPKEPGCDRQRMVCQRNRVPGVTAASFDSVTETMQRLLNEADRGKLVPQMVSATKSFEDTAVETQKLTRDGQLFVRDARQAVAQLNASMARATPIINNLNAASVDAQRATHHASRLAARLDNPKLTADLQATLANARQLTNRWQAVGGDVQKLTGDPKVADNIRSVSHGLARFFDDLYPSNPEAVQQRSGTDPARREAARSERQRAEQERLAPRSRGSGGVAPVTPPAASPASVRGL
jgi:phospholipid/cholesterol/gamma-HCH transport system substrate-binding protein